MLAFLFHSIPTLPHVQGPQDLTEVGVTKLTKSLCPLWKSEIRRGDPNCSPTKRERVDHIPHRYHAGFSYMAHSTKTQLCSQRFTELGWSCCSRGGRKGRREKKAATGRGLDFAGYSAHGTGCFITTFLTGFQIQPLLRILSFCFYWLVSISVAKYNWKNKTLRLG